MIHFSSNLAHNNDLMGKLMIHFLSNLTHNNNRAAEQQQLIYAASIFWFFYEKTDNFINLVQGSEISGFYKDTHTYTHT